MSIPAIGGVVQSLDVRSGDVSSVPREPPTAKPSAPVEILGVAVESVGKVPSPEEVKGAVEMINKAIQALARDLRFSMDEDTKSTVVKVVDSNTGEVIRQFPTEEVLQIAKALDKWQGMLIRQKA